LTTVEQPDEGTERAPQEPLPAWLADRLDGGIPRSCELDTARICTNPPNPRSAGHAVQRFDPEFSANTRPAIC